MKILIADDHVIFRNGLKLALETDDPTVAFDEAGDFEALLQRLAQDDPPDIIILDLNMPGLTRATGIMTIRGRAPLARILILSASEEAEDVFQSLSAGAAGYVAKSADIKSLIGAIRTVRSGGVHVPRELLVGAMPLPGSMPSPAEAEQIRLTQRQSEVLRLAAEGHANKEIAYRLGMGEGTVKSHLASVMRTLSVRNRVQMLREAERLGLIRQPG